MRLSSAQLQAELDQLLSSHDICKMFGITSMTLHTWRKERALPTVRIKGGSSGAMRDAVRFHPDDIAQWAKTQGIAAKSVAKVSLARARIRLAA